MNQIKLMDSKIQLYDKLIKEYTETQKKYEIALHQKAKSDKLSSHSDRLKNLDDSPDSLSSAYTESYQLEDITKEVEMREEYFNQLDNLNQQYGDDSNFDNALLFKEEVDKMLKDDQVNLQLYTTIGSMLFQLAQFMCVTAKS